MPRVIGVCLLVLICTTAFAEKKAVEWQEGTITDISMDKGSRTIGTFYGGRGMLVQKRADATYYAIEAGDYTYIAKRMLTRRHDKQLQVTVNAPIKFALRGQDVLLMDEEGKEHKLTLEKKILRRP